MGLGLVVINFLQKPLGQTGTQPEIPGHSCPWMELPDSPGVGYIEGLQ